MIRDSIQQRYAAPAAVFVLTLLCYVATIPNTITLEDAGLFQMICHNGGIGHPPGYPLFVLSCQLFVSLPFFGAGVFAANLLSAIFAGASCVVLYFFSRRLLADQWMSLAVAIGFGLSMTFWSQAIIVEVYSLAVLMFLACMLVALRFADSEKFSDLIWLAFLFGLSLSNHWPLHVLATPALIAIVAPRWKYLFGLFRRPGLILLLVLSCLVGLLPYLSLLQDAPAFAVYGSVESLEQFVRYLSRSAYSDHSVLAEWSDRWLFQLWLLDQSVRELHLLLTPLVLAGIYRSFFVLPLPTALSLILIYLSGTSLLNLLLGFEYNEFRIAIFAPYPVIAYVALAIWMGVGLQWLVNRLIASIPTIKVIASVLVCLLVFIGNYPAMSAAHNNFAEHYGEMVLTQVKDGSVLFVEGDSGVGLIGYLHYVRGDRPDLELRSWNNLVFPNRLASPYLPRADQNAVRRSFIEDATAPVFSTSHGIDTLSHGLVFQHNSEAGIRYDPGIRNYIHYLVQLESSDALRNGHERDLLFQLLATLTRQHLRLRTYQGPGEQEISDNLAALLTTWPGKLALLEQVSLSAIDEDKKREFRELGAELEINLSPLASRQLKGSLSAYRGRLELQGESDLEAAKDFLETSVAIYPHAANPAVCLLESTYGRLGLQYNPDALIKTPASVSCK